MFNTIKKIAVTIGAAALLAGQVYAANLSVRLEQPKSPTNQNDFSLNFVALDPGGNPLTAKCFKKAPGEAGFSQMGADIALSAGGNTANCNTGSAVVSGDGTYQFYVSVTNGSETVTSETVSVNYNTSGPGTPTNWSKDKIDDNTYKIHFRSADDAGKTVKVEVYRSDQTNFNLDGGTLVGTVVIGSNTEADFTNDVPDPSKTYYYAVRAFDSSGNGSGVLGDSLTHTTTVLPTTTTVQEALPVAPGTAAVLGESTEATGATGTTGASGTSRAGQAAGSVLSLTGATPTPTPTQAPGIFQKLMAPLTGHPFLVGGGILAAILGLIFYVVFL